MAARRALVWIGIFYFWNVLFLDMKYSVTIAISKKGMSVFSLVGHRRLMLCLYKAFNLTPSEVCQACEVFYHCSIYVM